MTLGSISATIDFRANFPFSHFFFSFSNFFISSASAFLASLSNFSSCGKQILVRTSETISHRNVYPHYLEEVKSDPVALLFCRI